MLSGSRGGLGMWSGRIGDCLVWWGVGYRLFVEEVGVRGPIAVLVNDGAS